jgi:AmmeMemoRadiSam system protein A
VESSLSLTDKEKKFLLLLARKVILATLKQQQFNPPEPYSKALTKKYGVFVSLHIDGVLRGCIGYLEGIHTLHKSVFDMAKSAAFNDPRFPPLSTNEMDQLEIEISVLSPLTKIKNIADIEVGRHGLVIESGHYKGVLLPQVPVEYQWDKVTFLKHTCLKAGLSPESWKEDTTQIRIFSAEIFSEKDFK